MKTKRKRVGLRILLALLVLILLTALAFLLIPITETVAAKTAENSADWMAKLDDGLYLNEIVLPGTHDSATKNVQLAFFSKCQALTIREQLEAGYRYLDIRLGVDGEDMKLMHGFTNCKTDPTLWSDTLYFSDVLQDCEEFLKAHPTETVILAVKQEHGEESEDQFAETLLKLMERYAGDCLLTDAIPTLGEARGKPVLFRRYESASHPEGIPLQWDNQNGHGNVAEHIAVTDNGSYRLWVQDRFEYGAEDKWNAFRNGLQEPGIAPEDLSIHFLSTKGTLPYGHPYYFARILNERLLALPAGELRGWIIADFGDAALASHIWSANFSR